MKYYIKKYQTPAGPIENTYWSDVKIEGLTPLKIEKIDTGQTKKVKVGRKLLYLQKDGTWSDKVDKNTLNGQNTFNYGKGTTFRWVDIYEDQPIYKGRYLYKNEDKPKPKPKTTTSKPTTKSTSSNVNNRVTIPEQYKEGLAEIKDGITYYTFPKYTNKQVTQAIQELFGNNVPTLKLLYKDYKPEYKPEYKENSILKNDTSNLQNLKTADQKIKLTETNIKNNNDSLIDKIANIFSFSKPENKTLTVIIQDPELTEYYAYPYKVDLFYSISPETYSLVLSYLKSKYGESGNKLKEYIFTEKPLTYYKPGETFRDTVYTFVNSGGVHHYPLTRSTLDYKNDRVSRPYNINKSINQGRHGKLDFSEYIPKIKDNKVKIPSRFSIGITYPDSQVASPDSFYTMDYENMDLTEKEKFKQYLKNRGLDINYDEGNYDPFDYFDFKLTDSQNKKIYQIWDENSKRRKKYK